MLTPDREGIEITHHDPRGAALQDPPASHLRARRRRQGDRAARRPARAARRWSARKSGDYFNRAELVKDLQARPHALPRRRLRQRRGRAGDRARPGARARSTSSSRSGADRSSTSSASRSRATPRRATRSSAARWRSRRASSSARRSSSDRKRRITALGYFERVDVSTEQGSTPDKININVEVARSRPARSRSAPASAQHRELHRHRADPAGEPVRQRAVARPAGAGLGAAAARRRCASSSRTSSTATGRRASSSTTQLCVFPDFARRSARRLAHLRLRAHPAVAAPQRSPATLE